MITPTNHNGIEQLIWKKWDLICFLWCSISFSLEYIQMRGVRAAQQRGSINNFHPAALGLNLGTPKNYWYIDGEKLK